jgi:hypothetical protein
VQVRIEYNAKLDVAFIAKTADEWCAHFLEEDVWHHKVMDINEVCKKRAFFAPFVILKLMLLPRQARDKHREN